MASTDNGFHMIIDTGSTMTVVPHFLRERLQSTSWGWKKESIKANGYGEGLKIYQASKPWLVCIGDGTNWSNWFKTREIYSWQKRTPKNINCGLVGYDILNNIPHYKPIRNPYIFLRNNDILNQLQGFE